MLDANMKSQLKAYLERLERPVEIIAFADDGAKSREMLALLDDIRTLSDKISVTRGERGDRIPSFALTSPGHDIKLTFAGLPMGHEFTSLVLALLQVGGYPPSSNRRCRTRSAPWRAISASRPISRSPARTAPMWCRR